jgi:hypothetical protein
MAFRKAADSRSREPFGLPLLPGAKRVDGLGLGFAMLFLI